MMRAFLLLIALQGAQSIQPPDGPANTMRSREPIGDCKVDFTGNLIFPAYTVPVHFIDFQLQPVDPYSPPLDLKSGPYDQFLSSAAYGTYDFVIELPGFDVLKQMIVMTKEQCPPGPGAHFDLQLHRSPAAVVLPIAEDAVSIENLMRRIPAKTIDAFEKTAEKEPKAGPEQTSLAMQEILKTSPDYYEANLELGLEFKKENRKDDAEHTLTRALELNSGSMLSRASLGQFRFEAGDFQQAADLLSDAARLGSKSADLYYMLGTSYYKLGQLDLAEAGLQRALDIDHGIGQAYLQLYNVYMKRNQPEKALEQADTYLKKYPGSPDHEYVRGMADKLRTTLKP